MGELLSGDSEVPDSPTVRSRLETIEQPFEAALTENRTPEPSAHLVVIEGRLMGSTFELKNTRVVVGRSSVADVILPEDGVSRQHMVLERKRDGWALVDLRSTNGVFVNGRRRARHLLHDGDTIQLGAAVTLKFVFQDSVVAAFQRQLYDLATRDSLTGTHNKRFFYNHLRSEFTIARRSNTPLSVALLDLDHFKRVNDTYGHLAGDMVLRHAAQQISANVRSRDILARYGGEEFALVMRNTDPLHAFAVAERVRLAVQEVPCSCDDAVVCVTASVGVATTDDSCASTETLMAWADACLYEAKRNGRNRTVSQSNPATISHAAFGGG